jgi:hypothetical protein
MLTDARDRQLPVGTAARMVDALQRGLYRVMPQGPMRTDKDGPRMRRMPAWTHDDAPNADIADAAAILRWHPSASDADAAFERAFVPDFETGVTITGSDRPPRIDPDTLPDIRFEDGASFWVDHDATAPGMPVQDRIAEAGRIHERMAARIIACRTGTPIERREVDLFHRALAATCTIELEEPFVHRVDAATPWNRAVVGAIENHFMLVRHRMQPDPDLLALAPMAASVKFDAEDAWRTTGRRPVVRLDSYTTVIDADDAITVMDAMRTFASRRTA